MKSICKKAPAQKGFTLLEMLVVISVIGVIIGLGVTLFGLTDDAKALSAAEEDKVAIAKIQDCHNSVSDFSGFSAAIALGRCASFKKRVTGAAATLAVTNSYGGVRAFAPASVSGGTNNGFTVTEPQIPATSCQKFIDTVWSVANRIDVGTTNIKTTKDQDLDANAIYTACGTTGAVTVVLTAAKGGY